MSTPATTMLFSEEQKSEIDETMRPEDAPVPTQPDPSQDTESIMKKSGQSALRAEKEGPPQIKGGAHEPVETAVEEPKAEGVRTDKPTKPGRPALPRFTTSKENVLSKFFIGSIDQGTTSTRFIIFDATGQPVASHQHEFRQHYPQSGWHEHDPQELVASVEVCVKKATASFTEMGHDIQDIRAIGITNQRETAVVWDYETGEPLHNTIAWPDTRTKGLVRDLKNKEKESGLDLTEMTGLPLSTYPSSVKLVWMIQHVDKVREAYETGRLAFGTVDTWLLYNLNGKDQRYFVTDSTNASRTMFMNLHTVKYDDKLLDFFGVDKNKVHLPRIVPSSDAEAYGHMADGPLRGMKIAGCLGDQSAALVGQQGFTPGSAKNTYGTGCFLLYNVGEKPVVSHHGLLATIAYDFGRHRKPVYALEGSVAVAGSGVKCKSPGW
jgi:glycerol kinase